MTALRLAVVAALSVASLSLSVSAGASASASTEQARGIPCNKMIRALDAPQYGLPKHLHWNNCSGRKQHTEIRAVFRTTTWCVGPGLHDVSNAFQGRQEPVVVDLLGGC
ncbi:hypothetical protein GCM10022247_38780 [Allokutzneria multivorans]|uniref:Uncharacterized protein n=1 Tax=Allokutzneria multivorans TaxID=1142134 RepID=A0ABP7SIY8_9PSEU